MFVHLHNSMNAIETQTIMNTKYNCFEYMIDKFAAIENGDLLSFTRLKVLKLLFFVTAISSEKSKKDNLLSIFDNFVAMPYGPVESDIYNCITQKQLNKYDISSNSCSLKQDTIEQNISDDLKLSIDNSIESLLKENPKILSYSPFELVDLSHKWSCWEICFEVAKQNKKASISMPSESIINSVKYYKL